MASCPTTLETVCGGPCLEERPGTAVWQPQVHFKADRLQWGGGKIQTTVKHGYNKASGTSDNDSL